MGLKEFVTKTVTTTNLNIPASNLEKAIGDVGETGLDGFIRYAIPMMAIYFYRYGAEKLEDKVW